jgi:hypothetical protein
MVIIFILCLLIGSTIFYWVRRSTPSGRVIGPGLIALFSLLLGWRLGAGFGSMMTQERYVFQFSRYSVILRGLAERQEIGALTNAVIRFDRRFNPRHDPQDLENVVREILASDPAWNANTNSTSVTDGL